MSTNVLSSVVFMLLMSWKVSLLNIFTLLIALPSLQYFILLCNLVQQDGRTYQFWRLLNWLNLFLFLFHLCSCWSYPKLSVRLHWKFKTDCNNNCNKTNTKIISHSHGQINLWGDGQQTQMHSKLCSINRGLVSYNFSIRYRYR